MNASKFLISGVIALAVLGAAPRPYRAEHHSLPAGAIGETMPESLAYYSQLFIKSRFSVKDFVPDGNLEKAAWKKAEWVEFERDAFSPQEYPQSKTSVASVWTPTFVYFAYRCKYTTLNIYEGEDPAKERWELWNRDVVEVFVNPQPERVGHYYEFEVAPNNQWIDLVIDLDKKPFNDAGWNSGFEHATHVDPQQHLWTCEMRIPARSMSVSRMEPRTEWRINFYRADGAGLDPRRRHLSWSPIRGSKHTFHTPTSFGRIQFVK